MWESSNNSKKDEADPNLRWILSLSLRNEAGLMHPCCCGSSSGCGSWGTARGWVLAKELGGELGAVAQQEESWATFFSSCRNPGCWSYWGEWTEPGTMCQGGGTFSCCVPAAHVQKIAMIMGASWGSEFLPVDCAQKSEKQKRSKRALQVCTYFIEGYKEPLLQPDPLGGSGALCAFWWAHKLVAWYKWRKEALSWGDNSPRQRRVKELPSNPLLGSVCHCFPQLAILFWGTSQRPAKARTKWFTEQDKIQVFSTSHSLMPSSVKPSHSGCKSPSLSTALLLMLIIARLRNSVIKYTSH